MKINGACPGFFRKRRCGFIAALEIKFHITLREKTIAAAAGPANVTEMGTAFWLGLGSTTIS
jgi:hypothetical protein